MTPKYIIVLDGNVRRYARIRMVEPRGYRTYLVETIRTREQYIRGLSAIVYDFSGSITDGQEV